MSITAHRLHAALHADPEGELEARVAQLHQTNQRLWAEEDAVRAPGASDAQRVAHKRAIDELNRARHAAINAIDAWLDARFTPRCTLADADVVLNSESIGQMLDRLSVIELKRAVWGGDPRCAGLDARAALLDACVERTLAALATGRALPQRFDEAKRYGA